MIRDVRRGTITIAKNAIPIIVVKSIFEVFMWFILRFIIRFKKAGRMKKV